MSDHQPDEAEDYVLPPPSGDAGKLGRHEIPPPADKYDPTYGRLSDEHGGEGRSDKRYVRMRAETHDDSRAYMAGRDQYIRERQDFSPVGRWIKRTADGALSAVLAFFAIWAACAQFGWQTPIQPVFDWVQGWGQGLPIIKEFVENHAK